MPVTVVRDNTASLTKAIARLTRDRVLVGIPDSAAERKPSPGEKKPPSNSVIGYLMEYGEPDKNIPSRPFLLPGVEDAKDAFTEVLRATADRALSGDLGAVSSGLARAGFLTVTSVQAKITDGPFVPLSERTIKARARRGRRGAKQYLKLRREGTPVDVLNDSGVALVKPLIDTGQLRRAVTYVIRIKGA